MRAACAASRAQSSTSRRAPSTRAIAVPQAPAPSTATRLIDSVGARRRGLAGRVLHLLQVDLLERDRAEQHRREAAADDEVRDRLAHVGEQDVRAGDAEQRAELLLRDV